MPNNHFAQNLKWLRKKNHKSQNDIALIVDKRPTAISSWENNLSEPSFEDLFKISDYFGIKMGDFLDSNLDEEQTPVKSDIETVLSLHGNKSNIKFNVYDFESKAAAGEALFLMEEDKFNKEPNLQLPYLGPGTHIRVPIGGDSMHSTLKDGDKAVATLINEKSEIRQGYIYIILDKQEGIVCKRIYLDDEYTLTFVSDNEIYTPYKRHWSDIISIFRVREIHSTDLRPYFTDLRKEMREIRSEMEHLKQVISK